MKDQIFISHCSLDDPFVKELRSALEDSQLPVWVDSRSLRGGDKLEKEIETAIEQASNVVVVLSPNTINSPWVSREIQKALAVEKLRKDDGYKVIPLLLPGVQPAALKLWFGEEPVGVRVELTTAGVSEALPQILVALGEGLPNDSQPPPKVVARAVEELVLKLSDPKIETIDGKRRASATALLVYEPANPASREVESRRFTFTAPLGPIEANELSWYLERYFIWPVGFFREQAARIEQKLPEWGKALYHEALGSASVEAPLNAWQNAPDNAARYFSIYVDSALPDGAGPEQQKTANEAASELLSLPWELLHDGGGYFFQGKRATRVRRRLPNRQQQNVVPAQLPIRILLASPRPEDNRADYIDHRLSAKPLMEAVESLGQLATLTVLEPPTFPDLQKALKQAEDRGERFDVVHFDGHGVYDESGSLGALCFEDPKDSDELERRASQLIDANALAAVMRHYRIPLVFLEACQSAKNEDDPTASVAAKLLEEGVASVVAMSHTVLVETAHRFVRVFYAELAQGKPTGAAMLAGQQALYDDTWRGRIMGAGDFHLQDWFVPVLYQEAQDPQLITKLLSAEVQQLEAKQRKLRLGALPPEPTHRFQGRSRELLKLERLLRGDPYVVVRGQGGAGKTTLAAELARWLVRTRRFRRAAFVSLEQYSDVRSVLDSLGRQLLPEADNYSVAEFKDLKSALQPVSRVLHDFATIIVVDNWESVLPDTSGAGVDVAAQHADLRQLFDLCQALLDADPRTRLVLTTREPLPAPFDNKRREVQLGALDRSDAIALVSEVMKQEGLTPKSDDSGETPEEIRELVDAANCHARALVVLAREVSRQGVRATTENLHRLMAALERNYPGDRENSLYASLELSLRRLPPEMREQAKELACFHGGAHLMVLDRVLETDQNDTETVLNLTASLIAVGLAEEMGYGHVKVDPALPSYMLRQMTAAEQEKATARWAEGMRSLVRFLVQERFRDVQMAATLTLLELPNLLAMLSWLEGRASPEETVELASNVESLISVLARKQALDEVVKMRERAMQKLGEWSHARFTAERSNIDRALDQGQVQAAIAMAQQLLQRCLAAGETAYKEANYDVAGAYFMLGRVLEMAGDAETALSALEEARVRFQTLADGGDSDAEDMACTTILDTADCFKDLGRLDEASIAYQDAIQRAEKQKNKRGVAVGKTQLGSVLLMQGKFAEARAIYEEARETFEGMGEPGAVAVIWHQIGLLHRRAGEFDEAERTYRQALALRVRANDPRGEADTLCELGTLYAQSNRLEAAVSFYRQAADIYSRLQDLMGEGRIRNNLGLTLIGLDRLDEARTELLRAIECNKPFGHSAAPWTTWYILQDLERKLGSIAAMSEARQRAIESFLAYRRAGGENQGSGASLCELVAQAIMTNDSKEITEILAAGSGPDVEGWAKAMVPKLQAILAGDRGLALLDDPNLAYDDAVELQLLLEELNAN